LLCIGMLPLFYISIYDCIVQHVYINENCKFCNTNLMKNAYTFMLVQDLFCGHGMPAIF
jgi:hypothetical protein